jgi:hypothetical protein
MGQIDPYYSYRAPQGNTSSYERRKFSAGIWTFRHLATIGTQKSDGAGLRQAGTGFPGQEKADQAGEDAELRHAPYRNQVAPRPIMDKNKQEAKRKAK